MSKLKVGDIVKSNGNVTFKGTYTILFIDNDLCTVEVNEEYRREDVPSRFEGIPLEVLYKAEEE